MPLDHSNGLILGGLGWTRFRKTYQRHAFLRVATQLGVKSIDTAIAYRDGHSELSIGTSGVSGKLSITTKIGLLSEGLRHPETGERLQLNNSDTRDSLLQKWFPENLIERYVTESLLRLKVSQLDAILLHSPNSVAEIRRLEKAMEKTVDLGLAKRFGVSLDKKLALTPEFAVVQIPAALLNEMRFSPTVEIQVNRLFRGSHTKRARDLFKLLPSNARPVVGTRSIIHLAQNLSLWKRELSERDRS